MRSLRARIRLDPKPAELFSRFEVPSDVLVVGSRDKIPLRLTGSVAQFICFSHVVGGDAGFSNRVSRDTQVCVGERKTWVEFDGVLEKRNGCGIPCGYNLET